MHKQRRVFLDKHHEHPTRSWMSWSTSSSSFTFFTFLCCCRDALQALVMFWYSLFLLALSSSILSSRGLVLPSSRLRAMDTYSGWSSVSKSTFPPTPLSPPSAFKGSSVFFKSLRPDWSGTSREEEEEATPVKLLLNSRFQRSLNAARSFSAMSLSTKSNLQTCEHSKYSLKKRNSTAI